MELVEVCEVCGRLIGACFTGAREADSEYSIDPRVPATYVRMLHFHETCLPRKYPVGTNQQYVDATLGEMVLEQFLSDAIQELGIKQSSLEVGTYSVLSTANPAGGLIIFKEDPDDRKYILSLADGFRSFRLLGWLYGHQAKRPTADTAGKYWNTGELASYPGFFVPQEDLNLMETLAER